MPLAPLAVGLALLAPSPTDIVLARSIGPVSLGQRRAQVEARIGKGKLTSVVNGDLGRFVRYRYDRVRLIVTYRSVGGSVPTAVTVTTNSTRYVTAKGMRVGLRKGPLRKAYPAINCETKGVCRLGLPLPGRKITTFRLENAKVVAIEVAAVND